MRNIYLIGMPGSGKSLIGQKLSLMLDCKFIDTDDMVSEVYGSSSEEIIIEDGEQFFRNCEHQILLKLVETEGLIVSTGGGMPVFDDHLSLMKENGMVIYLRVGVNTLWSRLEKDRTRPLSDTKEKTETLFLQRKELYENAHIIYDVEEDFRKNIKGIIKRIKTEFPGEIESLT
ncbi:MAG: shikimate kinase [Clostridiaceae bacterium]